MNLTNTKIVLKKRPNPEVSEDLFDKITDTVRELNEEEFNEIKDEIGMNYVEMTKATSVAIDEFCNDEIDWKYEEKDIKE